jgi:hypothetical protein
MGQGPGRARLSRCRTQRLRLRPGLTRHSRVYFIDHALKRGVFAAAGMAQVNDNLADNVAGIFLPMTTIRSAMKTASSILCVTINMAWVGMVLLNAA